MVTANFRLVSATNRLVTANFRLGNAKNRLVSADFRLVSATNRLVTANFRLVSAKNRMVYSRSRLVGYGRQYWHRVYPWASITVVAVIYAARQAATKVKAASLREWLLNWGKLGTSLSPQTPQPPPFHVPPAKLCQWPAIGINRIKLKKKNNNSHFLGSVMLFYKRFPDRCLKILAKKTRNCQIVLQNTLKTRDTWVELFECDFSRSNFEKFRAIGNLQFCLLYYF